MINVEICETFSCRSPFQMGSNSSFGKDASTWIAVVVDSQTGKSWLFFWGKSKQWSGFINKLGLIKSDLCKLRVGRSPRRPFVAGRYCGFFAPTWGAGRLRREVNQKNSTKLVHHSYIKVLWNFQEARTMWVGHDTNPCVEKLKFTSLGVKRVVFKERN